MLVVAENKDITVIIVTFLRFCRHLQKWYFLSIYLHTYLFTYLLLKETLYRISRQSVYSSLHLCAT